MASHSPIKIAFYNDSPVFGGHEVMTVRGVQALAKDGRFHLTFIHCRHNTRLAESLQRIEGLEAIATDFQNRKLDSVRNRIGSRRTRELAELLTGISPELLVVAQGDIESGCLGFFGAKRAGVPCASYIPVPHRLEEMGAKLATIRDALNAALFDLPDAFITISESMKRKLRDRGARQPIHVVFNGIQAERFTPGDQSEERTGLGLPQGVKIAGIAGRIEFNQKGQNVLLEALTRAPDWHAAFVGEGPDEERLRAMPAELGIDSSRVHFLPWSSEPKHFYRAIDLLALPSRFEGFPLVMLESVCCGTPVYASDTDGMSEFLPKAWRFRRGNAEALATLLEEFRPEACENNLSRLSDEVSARMTKTSFGNGFVEAVAGLAAK